MTYQWRKIPGTNSSLFIAIINIIPIFKIIRYPTFHRYIKQFFSVRINIFNIIIIKIILILIFLISVFGN